MNTGYIEYATDEFRGRDDSVDLYGWIRSEINLLQKLFIYF